MRSTYLLAFCFLLTAPQIVAGQTDPAPVAPVADSDLFAAAGNPNTQDWVPQESFVSDPDEGTGLEPGNFGSSSDWEAGAVEAVNAAILDTGVTVASAARMLTMGATERDAARKGTNAVKADNVASLVIIAIRSWA